MSREMHILRAQRITTGPQIRGTHPIVVSFENYRDKVSDNSFSSNNISFHVKTKTTNVFEFVQNIRKIFCGGQN